MHRDDYQNRITSLSLRSLLRGLRAKYLAVLHKSYPDSAHYHRDEIMYDKLYCELQRRGVDVEGYIRRWRHARHA